MGSAACMELLPAEIIHLICQELAAIGLKHVRTLRLVSKRLDSIAACHGLPELVFYLHESDFLAVRKIAEHPVISKHVTSLIYTPDVVEEQPSLQLVRGEYHHLKRQYDSGKKVKQAVKAKTQFDPALTQHQLVSHYQKIRTYNTMQEDLLGQEADIDVLKEVVPLFPNLRKIAMSSQAFSWAGHKAKRTPFDDGLMYFNMLSDETEGTRALQALLDAIPDAGSKIDSLLAGNLNPDFWHPGNESLPKFVSIAANLKHLELQIAIGSVLDEDDPGIIDCRDSVSTGMLKKVLEAAVNLESLYLDFTEWDEHDGYPALLEDVIGPRQKWPRLQSLYLGVFDCAKEGLEALLIRHKATLRHLKLRHINLRDGSWLRLLPRLREELDLETAVVFGELCGQDEDSLDPEYWNAQCSASAGFDALALTNYMTRKTDGPPGLCPLDPEYENSVAARDSILDLVGSLLAADLSG